MKPRTTPADMDLDAISPEMPPRPLFQMIQSSGYHEEFRRRAIIAAQRIIKRQATKLTEVADIIVDECML